MKTLEINSEVMYSSYSATVKDICEKDNTVLIVSPLFDCPVWVGIVTLNTNF